MFVNMCTKADNQYFLITLNFKGNVFWNFTRNLTRNSLFEPESLNF